MLPKKLPAIAAALCILFSGCAVEAAPEDQAQTIRQEYANISEMTATANISADYGSTVYEYKVRYCGSCESGTLEILEPQSIAGLSARVTPEKAELIYDGAELYAGKLSESGLSPMDAFPVMLRQWQSGLISESVPERIRETDTLAVTNQINETIVLRTWFDTATLLPVQAEISENGRVCITCIFENVVINQSQQENEAIHELTAEENLG